MTTNKTSWGGISIGGRKQWDCPVAFDAKTGRAYCGSNYVWTASLGSTSFTQISQDLTNGDHTMPGSAYIMGSVTAIGAYNGVCYAGSEDGNVWYSKNATGSGATWKKIRDGLIPGGTNERTKYDGWITDIWVDESDETGATAYLSVWYHRWGLSYYKPTIYKLTNYGDGGVGSADWMDIHGDMPCFITTYKVVKDNNNKPSKGYLYCATDYGMFVSPNEGLNWKWLGDDAMPIVPCKDMSMRCADYLFVGTYGRGMWMLPLGEAVPIKKMKNLSSKGNQIINNYPNPIVNKTSIRFRVKDDQKVSLGIYDLCGRLVKKVYEDNVNAHILNTVYWDVTNTSGQKVASGNYICRLIGERVTLARMITVKK
jgi:hypothetical protein